MVLPRDGRFGDPLGARIIRPKTPQDRRLEQLQALGCPACGQKFTVFDSIGPTQQTPNAWLSCRRCLASWEIDPQGELVNRKTVVQAILAEKFAHEEALKL